MIDADLFKAYNDNFGHQAGDTALAALAQCIAACGRRATDIVARYGGEEFAVLLSGETAEGAFRIAEQIRENVLALREKQPEHKKIPSVSIGVVSMRPYEGLSQCHLVRYADDALYKAKERGRNCCEMAAIFNLVPQDVLAA